MKTDTTFDRFDVRTLPTGRRSVTALRTQAEVTEIRKEGGLTQAQVEGLDGVVGACTEIATHCAACSDLESRYLTGKVSPDTYPEGSLPIDRQADRIVTNILKNAVTFMDGFAKGEPEHATSVAFQRDAYPQGAKYITRASFPEQFERMKRLLAYCQSHAGAAQVQALGLGVWILKLADILPRYEEAISKLPPSAVSYGQLRAAWKQGHIRLCQLVQAIFAAFPTNTPQDDRQRARLLSHLSAQEQAVAEMRRRRVPVKDIDPKTGNEVATLEIDD